MVYEFCFTLRCNTSSELLIRESLVWKKRPIKIVVDAGTGTTAIGLGLGAICLGYDTLYGIYGSS